ncbi:MAG: glycoside hydrolase family 31 protein [Clostridiaceae bacterium]|nr:glycoside hydrolase family 31 protein [Clostridiaceae bacterium]
MNKAVSNKAFPQFSENTKESRQNTEYASSLDMMRVSPSVQNRPSGITEAEISDNGVIFTFGVSARKSVLSYTHETSLNLYKPAEATVGRLYLHIELWTDSVFRVVFSSDKEIKNPYSLLPKDARMLTAEPEKVDFTFENNTVRTKEIEIRIDSETGKITANRLDGTEYFSELKTAFKAADIYDLSLSSNGNEAACFEAVSLETDEVIYGLGERFDSLTRNGRTVDFHNKDAVGTTSRRTYINIPFYLSTKGYGLFLNSSAETDWQIATTDLNAVQFGVLEGQLDYFVIAGETPKDIIKGYCHLTGFSKLPPLWSFGLWMSRNSYTSWEVVDKIAEEVRENDIPCDVLHLDTAWFTEDWNCDLKFSEERFPNPKEHIKMLNDKGFKVSLWQYNFIPPRDNNSNYHEAVERGYLAKNSQGKPYQLPESKKGSWTDDVIIDFSNPEARKWYSEKIKGLMDIGASAIKTDFGEGIPEDAYYHSIDGKHFHNLYSLVYNSTVFNASNENIVWARSGTAGSQRYPLHWGGDSQCSFAALAGTLRAALSLGLSGIPFFSHDIGGFIGTPDDELYIRWAQLGLFSSHSRCHGVGDNAHREPWYFSQEALEIFRFYDKLRYSLMPYIYSQAKKCTETGLPMMRALYLEYPEDRNTRFIDDEYLFGESLLIAPVLKPLSKGRTRDIYLPKGIWHDYFTREKIVSDGKWITREIDLKTMPIYVKDGAVLEYCSADTCLADGMGETVKTEKWQ